MRRLWRDITRGIVAKASIAVLIAGLLGCVDQQIPAASSTALRDLPTFQSKDGVLTAIFEATEQKVRLGHILVDGAVYHGTMPAPSFGCIRAT